MKRYIRSSNLTYTSLNEAQQLIDSINMTKGRRQALYNIQEWNVSPEDVAILAGRDHNGMIKFAGSDKLISVSYGPESPKADKTFILEYEDGSRRMYGWNTYESSYDGHVKREWIYLSRA